MLFFACRVLISLFFLARRMFIKMFFLARRALMSIEMEPLLSFARRALTLKVNPLRGKELRNRTFLLTFMSYGQF